MPTIEEIWFSNPKYNNLIDEDEDEGFSYEEAWNKLHINKDVEFFKKLLTASNINDNDYSSHTVLSAIKLDETPTFELIKYVIDLGFEDKLPLYLMETIIKKGNLDLLKLLFDKILNEKNMELLKNNTYLNKFLTVADNNNQWHIFKWLYQVKNIRERDYDIGNKKLFIDWLLKLPIETVM
jgi:hypothetical protein